MKPEHNAETRLRHYRIALHNAKTKFNTGGIYHVCLSLCLCGGNYRSVNIENDYPEFWEQRPLKQSWFNPEGSWFTENEDRIKAVERAIELTEEKLNRNELD